MKNDVVPVQIRGILPANSGCALFVGNDEKVFVINVEPQMGTVIGMFLRDQPKERPLTHDLMQSVFKGFGITVERVVITELKNSTYLPVSSSRSTTKSPGKSLRSTPGPVIVWRWRRPRRSPSLSTGRCLNRWRT